MLLSSNTNRKYWGRFALFCALVAILFILAPQAAFADEGEGSEPCALCHWSETSQWEPSPHGMNGVGCESCHGEYIEDHPEKGLMNLEVDAAECRQCHEDTHQQWQGSLHAESGVNCINCHISHSQTTRLSSEKLCCTCHSDGFTNDCGRTEHKVAGVACVDCHVSTPHGVAESEPAGHTFTAVPAQLCVDCHGDSLHDPAIDAAQGDAAAKLQMAVLSDRASSLSEELETAEKQNTSLQILAILTLGVGLGVGLIIGIILMLIFSYIGKNKETAS